MSDPTHQHSTPDELLPLLERQRAAFLEAGAPSEAQRRASLNTLESLTKKYKHELCQAINEDFGHRAKYDTLMGDVAPVLEGIRIAKKNLRRWMMPTPVATPFQLKPAKSRIHYQPLGCVGIIAPWNYPFAMAVNTAVPAIAAGNRLMIKPSEFTPRTSALIKRLFAEGWPEEQIAVCTGGPEVGAAFSALPFDHLLYTGSTRVGRLVMKAAAENLTPVTLELGGKSPTVLSDHFSVDKAAGSIAYGKLFNAGQTCVAPDYAMVPEQKLDAFVDAFTKQAQKMYPTLKDNPDYTSIVNEAHYDRITGLVDDARRRDARVVEINPANENLDGTRKLPPTLILDVNDDMTVMQEEIFGPVLPVMTYKDESEVKHYINAHPRPLAMYYFSEDGQSVQDMMEQTIAGGCTINDTLFHVAQENMPFGGVGPSGIGSYHGEAGFRTFSHAKSVFYQSSLNGGGLVRPPYGKTIERMLGFVTGK